MAEAAEIWRSLVDRLIKKHGEGRILAKKIGVSPAKISRWKHGHLEPSFSDLNAIARLEGVEIQDLWVDPAKGKRRPPRVIEPDTLDGLRAEIEKAADQVGRVFGQLAAAIDTLSAASEK